MCLQNSITGNYYSCINAVDVRYVCAEQKAGRCPAYGANFTSVAPWCFSINTQRILFFIFRFVKGVSDPIETLAKFTKMYGDKKTVKDREEVRKEIQNDVLFKDIKI